MTLDLIIAFGFGLASGLGIGAFAKADRMFRSGLIQGRLLETQERMNRQLRDKSDAHSERLRTAEWEYDRWKALERKEAPATDAPKPDPKPAGRSNP